MTSKNSGRERRCGLGAERAANDGRREREEKVEALRWFTSTSGHTPKSLEGLLLGRQEASETLRAQAKRLLPAAAS